MESRLYVGSQVYLCNAGIQAVLLAHNRMRGAPWVGGHRLTISDTDRGKSLSKLAQSKLTWVTRSRTLSYTTQASGHQQMRSFRHCHLSPRMQGHRRSLVEGI